MFELLRTLSNGHDLASFGEATGADLARPLLGWVPTGAGGPAADVHETADAIRVVLDLPGYAGDSISIQFENDVLSIQAERKREPESEKTLLVSERGFGKVRRSFSLKVPVDADQIAADYDRGVLVVTLPKRAEAKPRKIEVKVK
jgi:HSP20 family protein